MRLEIRERKIKSDEFPGHLKFFLAATLSAARISKPSIKHLREDWMACRRVHTSCPFRRKQRVGKFTWVEIIRKRKECFEWKERERETESALLLKGISDHDV